MFHKFIINRFFKKNINFNGGCTQLPSMMGITWKKKNLPPSMVEDVVPRERNKEERESENQMGKEPNLVEMKKVR